MTPQQIIDEEVDKADAEIMDWFYECCRINFGVEEMVQDSTELREILSESSHHIFTQAYEKAKAEEMEKTSNAIEVAKLGWIDEGFTKAIEMAIKLGEDEVSNIHKNQSGNSDYQAGGIDKLTALTAKLKEYIKK